MTHRRTRTLVAAVAGAVALTGCTPADERATPTPEPTATSPAAEDTGTPEPHPTPELEDPPLPTPTPEPSDDDGAATAEDLVAIHNGIAMQLHAIAAFESDDGYTAALDVLITTDGVPDGHQATLAEEVDGTWLTTVAGELQVTSPLGPVGEYEPATDEQVAAVQG